MFKEIILLLIDLGLLGADFKHHKRVKKEEEVEGRKKPFKKYLKSPSLIVYGSVFLILILAGFVFLFYQYKVVKPKQCLKEMHQIEKALQSWKRAYGQYPHSILELTKSKPLRKDWLKDSWNKPYYYTVEENGYVLISSGQDGRHNTNDDIKLLKPKNQ